MKVSDQKEKKDKMKIVDEILSSIKAFNKTQRDRASTPKIEKKKAFEELLSKYQDSAEEEDLYQDEGLSDSDSEYFAMEDSIISQN